MCLTISWSHEKCFNEKNQLCQANLVKYLILQIDNWRKTKTAKHQSAVRNICYPLATGRFGNTLHCCTIGTFSVALTNVFIKTNRIKFEPDPTLGKVAWWKCFLGISTISWSTQELARKGVPSHLLYWNRPIFKMTQSMLQIDKLWAHSGFQWHSWKMKKT